MKIPGLIEAEEFGYGGEGVGYSDSITVNIQQVDEGGGALLLARTCAGASHRRWCALVELSVMHVALFPMLLCNRRDVDVRYKL